MSTTGTFDQITAFFYRLYRSLLIGVKEKRARDEQLYSHARALDVLIATLFKRLYNFQSFLIWNALVAKVFC